MTPDDHLSRLSELAEWRDGLTVQVERANGDIAARIRAAAAAGVPKTAIAHAARLSRQSVYNVIERVK